MYNYYFLAFLFCFSGFVSSAELVLNHSTGIGEAFVAIHPPDLFGGSIPQTFCGLQGKETTVTLQQNQVSGVLWWGLAAKVICGINNSDGFNIYMDLDIALCPLSSSLTTPTIILTFCPLSSSLKTPTIT